MVLTTMLGAQSPFPSSRQSLLLSNAKAAAAERWISILAPSTLSTNYRLIYPLTAPSVGQMLWVTSVSGNDDSLDWVDAVTGSGTATQIAYWATGSTLTSSSNLYWDNTNTRLGIGTSSPSQKIDLMNGTLYLDNNNNSSSSLRFREPSSSGSNYTQFSARAQSANISYVLPNTQGAANSILTNDGSGNLSWGTGGVVLIQKPADESVTNTTTLQDDDDFSFSVSANQTYEIYGILRVSTPSGAGLKVQLTGPTGTSETVNTFANRSGADDINYLFSPTTSYNVCGSSSMNGSGDALIVSGIITTSSTAGTLKLQWTQNVANATSTSLLSASFLKITLVQ